MIDIETLARIRRMFYAEHWKIGTIARELGLHRETVSRAVGTDRFNRTKTLRPKETDPYGDFIRDVLTKHPRLRATRIYQMIRDRGYTGSIVQLRRFVACVRSTHKEVFLRLRTFPGEEGQVDWANFGEVTIGRARRRLSCFVITLSYSRALYFEFFFDQQMESFIRGHIHAFEDWQGLPRILAYDYVPGNIIVTDRGRDTSERIKSPFMSLLKGFRTFTGKNTDKKCVRIGQPHDEKRHISSFTSQVDLGISKVHLGPSRRI